MPTFTDGKAALVALKDYLQALIDSDFESDLSSYYGADVILEDDEPQESDRTGKPYISLDVESDELSPWAAARGDLRRVVVNANVCANDFNGAQTGEANPEGADTALARILVGTIHNEHEALSALGLIGISIKASRENIRQSKVTGEEHENPHQITFDYLIA